MFDLNLYSFFDYKFNILGYTGQDYAGYMRWVYLIFCLVLVPLLAILLRKTKHKNIDKYLKVLSVVMILLEITKKVWESYYDITTGRGFNWCGLLPFDTCSFFYYSLPIAAFCNGKIKEMAKSWLVTVGFAGGLSNILFIQGLKWYPFFTFGAFYSMFYHFMMAFNAFFLVFSGYKKIEWKTIIEGYSLHFIYSVPVIILDYIKEWDYMLYRSAGGVPVIEGIADKLSANGMTWATTLLMLAVYFVVCALLVTVYKTLGLIKNAFKKPLKEA